MNSSITKKKFEVWHVQRAYTRESFIGEVVEFPRCYDLVAVVEAADIEQVYGLTNHIDKPWWENQDVEVKLRSRSTSIGDVISSDNKKYRCVSVGWEEF